MSPQTKRLAVITVLGISLVLLIAHTARYWFLTDDAFISFRYAENLATGHGLLFNPGQERVEGYSNFLWVVLLAALRLVGLRPENAAPVVSLLATILLWAVVVRFEWRRRETGSLWLVIVAPLLLAATRSVAVWSTSGLETRLFELLVVAGTLDAVRERADDDRGRGIPSFAWWLALAALTRPDGLLVGACVIGASWVLASKRARGRVVRGGAVFAGVAAAHFLARFAYYGDWLPNTYYAKVGGAAWWSMGAAYVGAWLLEYGAILWIAPLFLAWRAHRARRTAYVPLLFAAAVLPHALYVISIGGDHFEYRPLDLYFPFAYLLVADGLREIVRRTSRAWIAAVAGVVICAGVWAIPDASHRQFPDRYVTGFPGRAQGSAESRQFLNPVASHWTKWPGIATLANLHRELVIHTTFSYVGIRQEEHVRFLEDEVLPEGKALRALVNDGVIARDAYVAIDCVGAIPYYSGLLVLDRLGLNDAHVARGERARGTRRLAHDKRANLTYARERGVHFWTLDPVHTLWSPKDDRFRSLLARARARKLPAWVGETAGGEVLLGMAPAGIEVLRAHFPGVRFVEVADPGVAERFRVP